jgi:hypothetical protein
MAGGDGGPGHSTGRFLTLYVRFGELVERFATGKAPRPSRLKLVPAGNVEMGLPKRADVVTLGYVGEATEADVLGRRRGVHDSDLDRGQLREAPDRGRAEEPG